MSYRHFIWASLSLPFVINACQRASEPGIGKPDTATPTASALAATPAPAVPAVTTPASDSGPAPSSSGPHELTLRDRLDIGDFTPPPHPPPTTAKQIAASHILIAYQGALHAPPTVTRSKDEAKLLAVHVAQLVSAGADFAELAVKYSDDPSVKQNFGNLGKFSRDQMEKPFSDAAFGLIVMEVTREPVETALGFHIIRRTE